ncbi:MAG: hypothetical protein ACTHW7_12345 [Actinomycetaceae bacterium]
MSIVDRFPAEWLTDVTVLRGGGRDRFGNPLPEEEIPLDGCLAGWGTTTEHTDRTDRTVAQATLYRRRDDFRWRSTDRVRITEDSMLPGTWAIDGEPKIWPTDVEIGLTREGA